MKCEEAHNMLGNKGRPVVFLDRDGVLCEEHGYVVSVDGLHIFPYAREAVRRLHDLGYLAIVITNQSAVARGLVTEEEVNRINRHLALTTGVDGVYCCPHYPPQEGEPEKPPYRVFCDCRKPGTGLIHRAVRDFAPDMRTAWFIGDRAGDIKTGQAVGAKTVLLESGYGTAKLEAPVKPDFVFHTLLDFVEYLEEEGKHAL